MSEPLPARSQRWKRRARGARAGLARSRATLWAWFGVGFLAAACSPAAVSPDPVPEPSGRDTAVVFVPGESYFGRARYIEYIAGDLPIILSAPHGGDLTPASILDRSAARCGGGATVVQDRNTRELVLEMSEALHARFGGYPHVVINHLHRRKLDANRDLEEAACSDSRAGEAWREFHDFLTHAVDSVVQRHGRGWYMDMHGHGHEIQRLELGYLLRGSQLDLTDEQLATTAAYRDTSSIRALAEAAVGSTLPELLRGPASLGALYEERGIPAVPAPGAPGPEGAAYFSGGYNTRRYACGVEANLFGRADDGLVCGVQIEANFSGVRDTEANRRRFAEATAEVLGAYLDEHWEIDLDTVAR